MSTAVADPTASVKTDAPIDLARAFYGSPSTPSADSPATSQQTSTPEAEPGSATPPQETVAPAAEVKPEPSKEAKDEKTKDEKAKEEESHRQAARRLGKQVQELHSKLDLLAEENRVLTAKANGTYEEPQGPTPEQIQARAVFEGRELASRELAEQRYGADQVQARIYDKGSELHQLLQAQPWHESRIANSLQPTLEAWTILEEDRFRKHYGNDPSKWAANILAEHEPALLDKLKKTLHATPTGAPAPSVTQARGDGSPSQKPKTLAELMYTTRA